MLLQVRLQDGTVLEDFAVDHDETVEQIKERLWAVGKHSLVLMRWKDGLRSCFIALRPPYEQCLIVRGTILDDTWTIDTAGLDDNSVVQLMFHDGRVSSRGRPAPVVATPPRKIRELLTVRIMVCLT